MKKFLILFTLIALLLCGCASAPTEPATEPSEPSVEITEPPLLTKAQLLDAAAAHAQLSTDVLSSVNGEFAEDDTYTLTFESETDRYAYTLNALTGEILSSSKEAIEFIRHPLTGQILDAPLQGRITAVVINNLQGALPQHGVSQADILYELETEGGITRCLAIFSDLSDVEKLGPVRSCRTFFNSIAVSYDAPLIHCGGSDRGIRGYYADTGSQISNWAHINEQSNSSYFYRDYDRYNYGCYAWEHTLFTNGEKLLKGLGDKGYNTVSELDFGLQFSEKIALGGETANTVTSHFRAGKTTTFTYNPETGLYAASQYGEDYIDANTGSIMTFRNIIVLSTDQRMIPDSNYYRAYYDLITSGDGYFACNGEIIPIKWSRDELRSSFSYTLADGTPLTLGVGTTYIAVVENATPVTYE